MTKLFSLLFREFKICKKIYITRFLLLLAFFAFIISGVSLLSAGMKEMPEKASVMKTYAESVSIMIILFSTMIFAEEYTFKSDLNSGWNNYSYTLPIMAASRAAVKLIRLIITVGISELLGFLCIMIINKITGIQFQIGSLVLLIIAVDALLLSKIITNHFIFRARNTDEYKKLQEKGSMICLVSMICILLIILKCVGFNFAFLLESDISEPLSIDILSKLTSEMLLWLIPLTLVFFAVYFAVIYHHSQYVYLGGAKIKKENGKAKKAVDLTAPHSEPVGFLYKELRQNTKSIFAVLLLPFIILVFMTGCIAFVSLSDQYGGDNWILRTLTSNAIRLASLALGFFSVGGLLLSVFHGDDKKLWAYFMASLPGGVNKFLYTKYTLSFAMCGLYFVSSYIAETLVATIRWFALGEEIVSFTGISAIVFFVLIILNAFSIPTMLRFGEKKGSIISMIVILSLAIAVILMLVLIPTEIVDKIFAWLAHFIEGRQGDISTLLLGLFPIFSVGAYILSYKVSCKIFMKGVTEYDR